jgi:hypothetical protein
MTAIVDRAVQPVVAITALGASVDRGVRLRLGGIRFSCSGVITGGIGGRRGRITRCGLVRASIRTRNGPSV